MALKRSVIIIICLLPAFELVFAFTSLLSSRSKPAVGESGTCADGTVSRTNCDKKMKKCSNGNRACGYLPKAKGTHKWWCCPSSHRTKTCPNGLKPRNQQCLTKKTTGKNGKRQKAMYCQNDEMCYKSKLNLFGYGLCCKAYICQDGKAPSGKCSKRCGGVCQKFQMYEQGIAVPGKFVKKCCEKEGSHEEEEKEEWSSASTDHVVDESRQND